MASILICRARLQLTMSVRWIYLGACISVCVVSDLLVRTTINIHCMERFWNTLAHLFICFQVHSSKVRSQLWIQEKNDLFGWQRLHSLEDSKIHLHWVRIRDGGKNPDQSSIISQYTWYTLDIAIYWYSEVEYSEILVWRTKQYALNYCCLLKSICFNF